MTSREFLARRWNIILLVAFWLAILLGVLILLTSRLPPESRVTAARPDTRERKVAPSARNKVTSALEPTSPVGEADLEYLAARRLLIIAEGKELRRGDVIGYVGDTGNAGTGNFHLHFGISKLASPRKWSGGEPINPYPLLVAT